MKKIFPIIILFVGLVFSACDDNQAPTAGNDTAVTDEGAMVSVNVVANDKDVDGSLNVGSLEVSKQPANGTTKVGQGKITYTPNKGFTGSETLTYKICDSAEKPKCANATLTIDVQKMKTILIETSFGNMKAKLYNRTPKHRDNFIKLASEGFFNDLLFHRVIKGFMIQGGDPDSKGAAPEARLGGGGPGYTIPAEFVPELFHKKGALSAARRGDQGNPNKESSGSQFYVVQGKPVPPAQLKQLPEIRREAYAAVGGTPFLDDNYTVFGEVVEGLEIIDKIAAVQTAPGDRPVEDVKMKISVID